MRQPSDNNFPVGCSFSVPSMHACAKPTLYVSLGNRRCSSSLPSLTLSLSLFLILCSPTVISHGSLQKIPNSSQQGFRLMSYNDAEKKKKRNYRKLRRETGRYLISVYKKDIPRVNSSRSLFYFGSLSSNFNADCIIIDTSRFLRRRLHRHSYSFRLTSRNMNYYHVLYR